MCSLIKLYLQSVPDRLKGDTVGQVFLAFLKPPIGALVAAIVSTFGIYFFASFLYVSSKYISMLPRLLIPVQQRDPWHMFSSFPQYLLLAPSFTNVLNVYAFCNLHDVSWGTKGSDKAEALPSVSSKKSKEDAAPVIEDTMKVQEDVDAAFKETVTRAVTKVENKEVAEKPTMDDQNKTFRTRLVSAWVLSNAGLAVAIENLNGLPTGNETADEQHLQSKQQFYFAIILYSTFGLAMVRFIGVSDDFSPTIFTWTDFSFNSVSSTSSSATFSGSAGAREYHNGTNSSSIGDLYPDNPRYLRCLEDQHYLRIT